MKPRKLKRAKKQSAGFAKVALQQQVQSAIGFAKSGQIQRSAQLFAHILSKHPLCFDALYHYGSLLYQIGDPDQALIYLERAAEVNQSDPGLLDLLSDIYYRTGRLYKGIKACRRYLDSIRKYSPKNFQHDNPSEPVGMLTRLGDLYLRTNQIDEAGKILTAAVDKHPQNILAHLLLAKVEKSQGNHERAIERLENFNTWEGDENTSAGILSDLGLLYDRVGRFQKAFETISKANRIQAAGLTAKNIDRKAVPALIKKLEDYLSGNEITRIQETDYDTPAPVFLVGFPRSGTTLTERILTNNCGLVGSTELPLLHEIRNSIPAIINRNFVYPEDLHTLVEDEIKLIRHCYWKKVEEWGHIESIEKNRFLDKFPLNIIHLPFVRAIFPESRVIVALRDPRDVCLSCFFQHFMLNESMIHFLDLESTVRFYSDVMNLWLSYKEKNVFGMSFFESRYEDIVNKKENSISLFQQYLGTSTAMSPSLVKDQNTNDNRERIFLTTPNHFESTQPVYNRSVERWKNYAHHLEPFSGTLDSIANKLGYPPT